LPPTIAKHFVTVLPGSPGSLFGVKHMGIFSRMGDIIAANVNDLLDKADDPAKMIRLIIMEMEETLIEVRASAARTIADQKEGRRTMVRIDQAEANWQEKAELALSKGREDLAKAALQEKHKLGKMAVTVQQDMALLDESLVKHQEDIQKLEAKLSDARARQQTIVSRIETAQNRLKVRELTSGRKVEDAFARFDLLDRRVDMAEARVDAFDLGRKKSLEEEINALQGDDALDAELAALKSRLQK
jgi:phage shock protein A